MIEVILRTCFGNEYPKQVLRHLIIEKLLKMKSYNLIIKASILFLGILLFSCDKDDDPSPKDQMADKLAAQDWDVKSWTEDGSELIPGVVSSFEMEFENWDGSEGEFKWVYVLNGATVQESGEFELNEKADEIELQFQTGGGNFSGTYELEIEFDRDELILEGTLNGYRYVIEAD